MIEVRNLVKTYGPTRAVDDLTFAVRPGTVTGFLGPNGAGKSTTMRMILGLDRPTSGVALVRGRPFAEAAHPLHEVGALLDAKAAHPGLRIRDHLRILSRSNGLPDRRVEEVLGLLGLTEVAGRRIRALSLGMGQRVGMAAAMLGDPGVLILDEPVNGLDPEGIAWVRTFLGSLAKEGRTILVSSHLMSEMALTAERLVVIGRGRLIADTTTEAVIAGSSGSRVHVRSPQQAELGAALERAGLTVAVDGQDLVVAGTTTAAIGDLAHAAGVALHELREERASLEQAYLELTAGAVQFHGAPPAQGYPPPGHQPPPGYGPPPGYQAPPGYAPGYQVPPGYGPPPGYQSGYDVPPGYQPPGSGAPPGHQPPGSGAPPGHQPPPPAMPPRPTPGPRGEGR